MRFFFATNIVVPLLLTFLLLVVASGSSLPSPSTSLHTWKPYELSNLLGSRSRRGLLLGLRAGAGEHLPLVVWQMLLNYCTRLCIYSFTNLAVECENI